MSWKCSRRYWELGPLAYHAYTHALDPKRRVFHELFAGRHGWQVWPPRSVLNPENEWTMPTRADLVRTVIHCHDLLLRVEDR